MEIFHEMMHEFEKPICIILSFPRVGTCVKEVEDLQKKLEKEIEEVQKKYQPIMAKAADNITKTIKEEGLWPYDFNEKTDHLMIKNGVLFYARHKDIELAP